MSHSQTVVVKLGTSVLTAGTKKINQARLVDLVRQCAILQSQGHKVVIVTSGAIAAGREYLNYPDLPSTTASKQLLAAVGQTRLIQLWEQLFSIYHLHIGQMLLTRADIEDKERFLNARDTLHALIDNQIIPVINENDAVVTAEIKVGDNDNLSALVGMLASADKLLLLTDQKGLFTADPRKDPNATLIEQVEEITDELRLLAGGSVSGLGTGGMSTKLQAADVATRAGIEVIIASGDEPDVLLKLMSNDLKATRFSPQITPIENRKRWIFGAPIAGKLIIDSGAVEALLKKGSSLLPKGILGVESDFTRGEVVLIEDTTGKMIARGVTRYNSDALRLIAGKHSNEILQVLGYVDGTVAIHRDELILA